jgi:Tfp pilus assembly protein PilF
MQSTTRWRWFVYSLMALALALVPTYFLLPVWIASSSQNAILVGDAKNQIQRLNTWESILGKNARFEFARAEAYRKLADPLRLEKHVNRAIELGMSADQAKQPLWLWLAQSGFTDEPYKHLGPMLQSYAGREYEVYESFLKGYAKTWHLGDGRRLIELWREQNPDNPRINYWDGVYRAVDYQIAPATQLLQKAVDQDPEYWEARLRLAELLVEQSKLPEAEEHFEILVQLRPEDKAIKVGYAQCLLNQGRAEEAWTIFKQVVSDGPEDSAFLYSKAQSALDAGHAAEAQDILTELVDRWPEVAPFRELQARTEQALGNAQKAEEYFAIARASQARQPEIDKLIALLDSNPSDLEIRRQLGHLMMYYLSPEAGSGQILSVLAMETRDAVSHQLMADFYRRERMTTQSLRHQQMAEQLMPEVPAPDVGVISSGD